MRIQGSRVLKTLPALKIPGVLDLEGCAAFETLSAGTTAAYLKLRGCSALKTLPENLTVSGRIDLRNCSTMGELPKGLKVGFGIDSVRPDTVLFLNNCSGISKLPADMQVKGSIEVAGSGLKQIPPALKQVQLTWRGVRVPHECVTNPEKLNTERILTEANAELRRTMLERVGMEKVLTAAGAVEVDADQDAGGIRKLFRVSLATFERDNRYLLCQCPSTGRKYLLRVPPGMSTCRKAAAWIAGFENEADYRPIKET